MDQIKAKLIDQKKRFEAIAQNLNKDYLQTQIRELEAKTMHEGFWSDQQEAKKISKRLSEKQKELDTLEELESRIKNALEMVGEPSMEQDLKKETDQIEEGLSDFELKLFLSGKHDPSEAILSVHSGAGGVEAMDWCAMLARMYQRFFEQKGWEFEITDESPGEEAGFKT